MSHQGGIEEEEIADGDILACCSYPRSPLVFGSLLMEQNPSDGRTLALETLAVGAGYDPAEHGGAAKPPIYMTSTFVYASAAQARAVHQAFFDGDVPERSGKNGYIYARLDHPNLVMAQTRIAALDRAEDSALFSSGMAAVSTLAMTLLRPGDSMMHSRPIYGGTDMLLHSHMTEMGVTPFRASPTASTRPI